MAKAPAKTRAAADVALYEGYDEDAGLGFGNQTSDYIAIPFISILESNSAEVTAEEPLGKAGDIINRTTGDVTPGKEGVVFVCGHTDRAFLEWVPIDDGGGLVAEYKPEDPFVVEALRKGGGLGKIELDNGNELVETFYAYGVLVDDHGDPAPAVLTFTSTRIKAFKGWQYKARQIMGRRADGSRFQMPLMAHKWRMTTERTQKGQNVWHVPVIKLEGGAADTARIAPDDPAYHAAKSVRDGVMSGEMAADRENAAQDADGSSGAGGDADVPF